MRKIEVVIKFDPSGGKELNDEIQRWSEQTPGAGVEMRRVAYAAQVESSREYRGTAEELERAREQRRSAVLALVEAAARGEDYRGLSGVRA